MNGVTDGSIDVGMRTSPSLTSSERDRRLKARMAELADKNRAVTDGGGDHLISPSTGTAPVAAPRSTTSSITTPSALTGSTGGALPRYSSLTSNNLDKAPTGYSSYRYTGFSSRLKSGYDQPSNVISQNNGPTLSPENNPSSSLPYLTTKRDLFFRDGPTSASTLSSSTTVTTNGTNSAKDQDEDNSTARLASSGSSHNKDKSGTSSGLPTKEVEGYVGFAVLPNQVYRKAVKRGFEFTLMVVGESGLGKSTLINSMFLSDIYSNEYPGPSLRQKKTVQVETSKVSLKENGVNLQLTIVDTPGFGDAVDNTNCWQPVIDYIETQYEEYLNSESRVNRRSMPDNRVHCCIYFIAPSGHGLKPLDVEFIKRLQDKVNIIPVIAKSDTMTPEECALFKKTILNEITQNKIKVYEFPECDDEEDCKNQKTLKDRVPFAVVGSNVLIDSNGKKVRGRRYPWGTAEVENLEHCDFLALRNMLIRTHMQDLKDITNNVHYENYRYRRLAGVGNDGKPLRVSNKNPLAQMEEEKRDHDSKMKKMEQEMEQVFEMKVKEKKQKLKDSETDLQRRHEQMKKNLEQQQKELEEKRKAFEKEKGAWEEANKVSLDDLRRRSLENNSKESNSGASSTTSLTSIDVVRKPSFLKLKRSDTVPRRPTMPPPPPAIGATNANDPQSQNCRQMQMDGKEKKKEKKKGLF